MGNRVPILDPPTPSFGEKEGSKHSACRIAHSLSIHLDRLADGRRGLTFSQLRKGAEMPENDERKSPASQV
jgi:hypothetical protein